MNNERLLRTFDTLTGILVAYDNQSRNPGLNQEGEDAIEIIRELIKNRPELGVEEWMQ